MKRETADDRRFRLDPVRWPGPPRRATLARTALVAALLVTAATLVYAGGPQERCDTARGPSPAPAADRAAASPDAAPSGVTGATGEGLRDDAGRARRAVPAGAVGVVVTLAEPAALGVLRAGDRVDLLHVGPAATGRPLPATVAAGALVLATPDDPDSGAAGLYLALRPEQARAVVALPPGARFAVLVHS